MSTISLATLRERDQKILVTGNHPKIMQSVLDFDYAAGKASPSILAIVSAGRRSQKLFWGDSEVLIPVFASIEAAKNAGFKPDFLLNITSASSACLVVETFFTLFPDAYGAHIFAEGVSERDALRLVEKYGESKLIAGPSGVGICLPGSLKLGAIGGILGERVAQLGVSRGTTAVVCSSGGMVNELMYQIVQSGSGLSFCVAFGGDRFPVTSPLSWILAAENDPQTKDIVFFGELGGTDEYDLAQAIKDKRVTKPVYAYIAGRFEAKGEKIQFGHAKALAKAEDETAAAKMKVLREAGAHVSATFSDFMAQFTALSKNIEAVQKARSWTKRSPSVKQTYFSSPAFSPAVAPASFSEGIVRRLLLKESVSRETVAFFDLVLTELIDHGPHVSGAVTAMITARAGRDMGSALASGVLTVGDRFGGAINNAANVWHDAVSHGTSPDELVALYSKNRDHIPGIGHKKYSVYKPDQRVSSLLERGKQDLSAMVHTNFALTVAHETSKKRSNLILNVDGATSALLLDYLVEKEKFSVEEIQTLLETEFFNSLFYIARSVGFIGNFLDQKRIDEGLFRLSDEDILQF